METFRRKLEAKEAEIVQLHEKLEKTTASNRKLNRVLERAQGVMEAQQAFMDGMEEAHMHRTRIEGNRSLLRFNGIKRVAGEHEFANANLNSKSNSMEQLNPPHYPLPPRTDSNAALQSSTYSDLENNNEEYEEEDGGGSIIGSEEGSEFGQSYPVSLTTYPLPGDATNSKLCEVAANEEDVAISYFSSSKVEMSGHTVANCQSSSISTLAAFNEADSIVLFTRAATYEHSRCDQDDLYGEGNDRINSIKQNEVENNSSVEEEVAGEDEDDDENDEDGDDDYEGKEEEEVEDRFEIDRDLYVLSPFSSEEFVEKKFDNKSNNNKTFQHLRRHQSANVQSLGEIEHLDDSFSLIQNYYMKG